LFVQQPLIVGATQLVLEHAVPVVKRMPPAAVQVVALAGVQTPKRKQQFLPEVEATHPAGQAVVLNTPKITPH
jgi:hypothetical protein